MLISSIIGLCGIAQAESVAFSTNVTVSAGTGTFTYSAKISKDYGSSFRILGIIANSALVTDTNSTPTTNLFYTVDGTVTNYVGVKVPAANNKAVNITGDYPHFRNTKVLFKSSDTNTFTATLVGIED